MVVYPKKRDFFHRSQSFFNSLLTFSCRNPGLFNDSKQRIAEREQHCEADTNNEGRVDQAE